MSTYRGSLLAWEQHLLYLRKSRQDDPRETVEEVLSKHETQLQEYAEREFGGRIPEENIYREIVSGENIEDREEVQKVLARIEDPMIKGVLVIEPQRLSRGDLEDCGRLISDFRYTHTLVVTPYMTYDLENKMERKFFQDELLRGRDFLEYTKEILQRGRIASVKRGCYVGNTPPFGYNKITIGKDHTLEINEEQAEIVRLIFDMYIKGVTPGRIAIKLNEMGFKSARGGKWVKSSVRAIISNEHYTGKVVFNKKKLTTVIENGERKVKNLRQDDADVLVVEGKHPAILDAATWEAARKLVALNPREKHTHPIKNPLAGVIVCGKCGKAMFQHPYKHAETRYECRSRPICTKSVKVSILLQAVIDALEISELPELELKVKNGDGKSAKIQQRLLAKLEKQMADYHDQEDKQFELLETGRYTQDLFDRRNAVLRDKMEECQKQIYQAKAAMPKDVDYEEKLATLREAIKLLKDPTASPIDQNQAVRAVIERIEYYSIPSIGKGEKGYIKGYNSFNIKVRMRY
jgi:DNA invertase Pin-like site-specific DNA recombinase